MNETGFLLTNISTDLATYYVARKCYEAFANGKRLIDIASISKEIPEFSNMKLSSQMKKLERISFITYTSTKGVYYIERGENFLEIVSGGVVEESTIAPKEKRKSMLDTLEDRRYDWKNKVIEANNAREKPLPTKVLVKFLEWWGESNMKTGVMKWENTSKYPTWEPGGRLSTWYQRAVEGGEIQTFDV